MTKKNDNPFGDFAGTTTGEAETVKWEFPGIGYNASNGIFYVNEDQVDTLTLVPLALRQCKEVEDINGSTHRYPVNMPRNKMAEGDITYRVQVACIQNDEIFVFGARSWTARASWLNPRGGQWRDKKFETGLWYMLQDFIKEQFTKHNVQTTPLCWELSLVVGKETTVGSGKNTSKSKPIVLAELPAFVGLERVEKNAALYEEEDLAGWVAEWKKRTVEAVEPEPEPIVEESLDDIEGLPF